VTLVQHDAMCFGGPTAGFTQRGSCDPTRNEIYIVSGIVKETAIGQSKIGNHLWIYNCNSETWRLAEVTVHCESMSPLPRYAHQVLYHPQTQTHYMFGGNPASKKSRARLGDLWRFYVQRPQADEILAECAFQLRCLHARDLAARNPVDGIQFLRSVVAPTVLQERRHDIRAYEQLVGMCLRGAPVDALTRKKVTEDIFRFIREDLRGPSVALESLALKVLLQSSSTRTGSITSGASPTAAAPTVASRSGALM